MGSEASAGRATAQPNVPGRGIVAGFGWRFWLIVVGLGVVTGIGSGLLLKGLDLLERALWGNWHLTLVQAIERTSSIHRVLVLLAGGLLAGAGALFLRRIKAGTEVSEALWLADGRLPLLPSIARALDSIIAVGFGASLGLEAGPQQIGASFASAVSDWAKLPSWQRRLLVACGAGSGIAAVYNMPLGGALFALEVLLGALALPLVLPAIVMTVSASAAAWLVIGNHPTYITPRFDVHPSQIVWALIAGPIAGLLGVLWIRTIAAAHKARPSGPMLQFLLPVAMFAVLGVVAIGYPQVLGNGKAMVQLGVLGRFSLGLFAILLILKPLMTGGTLSSGVPGGLFTPTLAIGTMFGGLAGGLWLHVWPGGDVGAYALIGGAAMLGAAMQGPLSAIVMVLELMPRAAGLTVPILIAVATATVVARIAGAHSLYSVRLAQRWTDEGRPEPPRKAIPG